MKDWEKELYGTDAEQDPELMERLRRVREAVDACELQTCSHGCCVDLVHPDGRVFAGWGPAGCPCVDEHEYADDGAM